MKKISVVKSETHFSREAIKNQRGKVLKENSIIGRGWSSAKLFIVQGYTKKAHGDVPLTVETVRYFCFFEFKVRTRSFFVKDIFIL